MKPSTFLLLFIFFFSFSAYPDICESQFLRSYYSQNHVRLEADSRKTLEKLFQLARKEPDLRQKLELLDEQYSIVKKLYLDRMETVNARVAKLEVPMAQRNEMLEQAKVEIVGDLRLYPNRIVTEAQKLFNDAGIPVKVRYRKVGPNRFKYLELGVGGSGKSAAIRKIQRYKERFGTKVVTFDFFENITVGVEAISYPAIKRIDLGIRGLKSILLDDLVTMIGKHEFHHAAFAAKRANNVSSIYHTSYRANGVKNLSSLEGGYDRMMSAEELYNWANNSFWASSRIMNIRNFHISDYLDDLASIHMDLKGTRKIAQSTQEITENTVRAIKAMRKEIDDGDFTFIVLTEKEELARGMDEAFNFVLFDDANKVLINEFIGPEYADEVAIILKNRKSIEVSHADELAKADSANGRSKIMEKLFKEENRTSKNSFLKVLRTFEKNQRTLGKVASTLEVEAEAAFRKTDDFVVRVQKALETNKDALSDPRWAEEFKSLGQEYRKLGNLVKEDYKGFAGR